MTMNSHPNISALKKAYFDRLDLVSSLPERYDGDGGDLVHLIGSGCNINF